MTVQKALAIGVAIAAIAAVAPVSGIYPVFLMKVLCFALFACAFNLLLGFAGLLSFGHAAFFGSAGYLTGYAVKSWGLTPELGILAGVATSGALGWAIGRVAIRRQGIYFAMITLALAQMVYFLCVQAPFTGAEDGLLGIPRGKLFGILSLENDLILCYVIEGIFLAGFFVIYRVIYSPFGQVLKAIRENEPRAVSLGYDVDRYKLLAFVLSAALAGLAGSSKALIVGFVTLNDVFWGTSGEVILMTLLGGMGTLTGPVVGAVLVITLQNVLADKVGAWVQVIMGAIFIASILLFRKGIVGELSKLKYLWSSKRLG